MELAAGRKAKRQVGPGARPKKARPPATAGLTLRRVMSKSHGRRRRRKECRRPGRENCPDAGPVRALSEEHQPRMTRTGDVSTAARPLQSNVSRTRETRVLQTAGDARHENRKGD